MAELVSAAGREEWRTHWKLVLASAFGVSLLSLPISSFGAYIVPLEQALGWKRAEISSGLTVMAITGLLLGPVLGRMIDRWGPRRFGVAGLLLGGVAYACLGTVSGSVTAWIVLWIFVSVTAQIPRPMIWSAAIASEFTASRGLALAVMLVGSGIGAMVAPILAGTMINAFGWRVAYAVTGLGWGGLAGLICYFFFHCRLDQKSAKSADPRSTAQPLAGVGAREALTSGRFARLVASIVIGNTLYIGLYVHMIPILVSVGVARDQAAWMLGLGGFASIASQLTCGVLADRVPGRFVSAVSVSLLAVASAVLLIPTNSLVLHFLPVVCVAVVGGERVHMLPYLTTRYFGLKSFGTIFGVVASSMAIPVGLGPLLAGYVYDRTHSYDLLLMVGIPVGVITALLTLSLGRYPAFEKV